MGCGQSDLGASPNEKQKNRQIMESLVELHDQETRIRKILLLGTGESGKSTLLKQMRILYNKEYSDTERANFKFVVSKNVFDAMQTLIKFAMKEGAKFDAKLGEDVNMILGMDPSNSVLTPELGPIILRAWNCDRIQQAFARRNEYQLMDNIKYFTENLERIASATYEPTDQDILMARMHTSGVVEMQLKIQNLDLKVFDVGGQRTERRKWIHCFDRCDLVLFVAAINEYNQCLLEDSKQNRVKESLNLFSEICNLRYFEKTHVVLFLNKRDLFAEKIRHVDLKETFPAYEGGDDYEKGIEFLKALFLAQNKIDFKMIHVHVTCATDTTTMRFIFDAVTSSLIMQNLRLSGYM